jgi:hypothetical protein
LNRLSAITTSAVPGQRLRLLPPPRQNVRGLLLHPAEVLRRRDVVVQERLPSRQRRKYVVDLRPDRQVQQHHVLRPEIAPAGRQVAGLAAQFGQNAFLLGIDLRVVAPRPEQGAHHPHLVADGVSVGVSGHNLMNRAHVPVIQ